MCICMTVRPLKTGDFLYFTDRRQRKISGRAEEVSYTCLYLMEHESGSRCWTTATSKVEKYAKYFIICNLTPLSPDKPTDWTNIILKNICFMYKQIYDWQLKWLRFTVFFSDIYLFFKSEYRFHKNISKWVFNLEK